MKDVKVIRVAVIMCLEEKKSEKKVLSYIEVERESTPTRAAAMSWGKKMKKMKIKK